MVRVVFLVLVRCERLEIMNKDWLKELANDKSLYEMAKERGFECNDELKFHYRYLEQYEKERNQSDAEKVVK